MKKLVLAAVVLAFCVVVLGAFVRLSDAGLGCPDWPGCYGQLSPHHAAEAIAQAESIQPGGPVSQPKAWKEMIHRYLASTLGLLIVVIGVQAWLKRERLQQSPWLASGLVVLVILQGLLGMWTVTLLLKPVIVTLHLLGGMATFALLVWLLLRQGHGMQDMRILDATRCRRMAALALLIVCFQIALGGWTSSNYAALACADFPTCNGAWLPPMDFQHAFHFVRDLGKTAGGDLLPRESLTAIHWMHRVGAVLTLIVVGAVAIRLLTIPALAKLGALIGGLLVLQIGLGIANVLLSLPLPVAVAHNGVAALLLISLVMLNFRLNKDANRP